MTKYLLYLTFLLITASSCHRSYGPWQNWGKWALATDRTLSETVRSRPRQVAEYIYLGSDTIRLNKWGVYYIRYGFDPEGNLVSRNSYHDDTLTMKVERWLDGGGIQERMTNMLTGEVIHTISRRLSDGRYKTVTSHLRGGFTAWLISFPAGGNERIQEIYGDTVAQGKPDQVIHFYYKGSRLMRLTAALAEGAEELRYYYSASDLPDSILTYRVDQAERTLVQRQLFLLNDHGDVKRDVTITGKDTTFLEENSYTYDSRGNWIRQVSARRKVSTTNGLNSQTTVTDRKFVY